MRLIEFVVLRVMGRSPSAQPASIQQTHSFRLFHFTCFALIKSIRFTHEEPQRELFVFSLLINGNEINGLSSLVLID